MLPSVKSGICADFCSQSTGNFNPAEVAAEAGHSYMHRPLWSNNALQQSRGSFLAKKSGHMPDLDKPMRKV